MSSPSSGFHFQQFAQGSDASSIILDLRRRVEALERASNQGVALGWNAVTPPMPASLVPVTNPYSKPVTIYMAGGTVTHTVIDGLTLGLTSGTFRLVSLGTIAIEYTVAPAWIWYGD
jgi:hypothetical protein